MDRRYAMNPAASVPIDSISYVEVDCRLSLSPEDLNPQPSATTIYPWPDPPIIKRSTATNVMNAGINATLDLQGDRSLILVLLHKYLPLIIERFYGSLPMPALSFSPARLRVLGWYCKDDSQTPSHRIGLNSLYAYRPFPDLCRTVTHELGHLWQQVYGNAGKRWYHNVAFQKKMLEIGIPCSNRGHSLDIQEPFEGFLKQFGLNNSKLFLLKQAIQENPGQFPNNRYTAAFLNLEKTNVQTTQNQSRWQEDHL